MKTEPEAARTLLSPLRRLLRGAALLAAVAALSGAPGFALAARAAGDGKSIDYRLGTGDKVRLKVFEWRPSRDEIFEWEALNDEYTVSPAGNLSLPLIGPVPAAGLAADDLAKAIQVQLEARLGLTESPAISVDIVQFRPFYIAGQVDRPGEYPYRPGLTVLQAVSIAGGLQRAAELGLTRLIAGVGELQLHALDKTALLAKRARLEAELAGTERLEFPPLLTEHQGTASVALVLQQERQIFDQRREAMRTQIAALGDLKSYLQKEVVSLTAQVDAEDRQMSLLKEEMKGVSSLASRGLVSTPRQLGLERTLAQMEGDKLRRQSELMRARQEISKTEISILELRNKRAGEVALELRQTQAAIEQIAQKAETSERLVNEASGFAQLRGMEPVYSIVRSVAGQPAEIAADEGSPVEPGDTVKVRVPLLLGSPYAGAGAHGQPGRPAPPAATGRRTAAEQTARD